MLEMKRDGEPCLCSASPQGVRATRLEETVMSRWGEERGPSHAHWSHERGPQVAFEGGQSCRLQGFFFFFMTTCACSGPELSCLQERRRGRLSAANGVRLLP